MADYPIVDGGAGHIPIHNDLVAQVRALAQLQNIPVTLPPDRALGDLGHLNDHQLIKDALLVISQSAGLPGYGSWAQVTATTGSPTTGTYTDGNGVDWKYYQWTADGSVTLTEGVVEALLVGGGGGSGQTVRGGGGGGGAVLEVMGAAPAGTHSVTVGQGGAHGGGHPTNGTPGALGATAQRGGSSYLPFIDVRAVGGGGGGGGVAAGTSNPQNIRGGNGASGGGAGAYSSNSAEGIDGMGYSNDNSTAGGGAGALGSTAVGDRPAAGIFSSFTGTLVEYGAGGSSPNGDWGAFDYTLGIGWGGRGNAGESGGSGTVIIRVPVAFALA